MSRRSFRIATVAILLLSLTVVYAASPAVRIKDVARVYEARANQLMGFGLVVGLRNSGDSAQSTFTQRAMTNLLAKLGIAQSSEMFKSRNVAAVMVTGTLPPFMKPGQKLDVVVSSMGDATSLKGGTLLQTPLQGADSKVYAVCQGAVVVAGDQAGSALDSTISRGQPTVGRVLDGAIVERSVPAQFDKGGFLTLVLDRADFTTAARLSYALDSAGISGVQAVDASTVQIPIPEEEKDKVVDFISRVEDVQLIPDSIAKVVVNQRTGTIVIGESVRLAPVAISHGDIEVQVSETKTSAQAGEQDVMAMFQEEAVTETVKTEGKKEIKLVKLQAGTSLSALVKALNSVGTSPRDLVAILQALKSSGALSAELEVI
jgi:flagellar P-ring protein precursor FlgI